MARERIKEHNLVERAVAKVNLNPFHKYDRCSKLMDHRDMSLVYRLEIDKGDISEFGREERGELSLHGNLNN